MTDIPISQFPAASSANASDVFAGVQEGVTKKFSLAIVLNWLKQQIASLFVPTSREINGKALSSDITLDASDVGAYELPSGGIPKADLAQGVQDSLDAADSAYQLPSGGIPDTDLDSAVQTSLGLADTAYQLPAGGMPSSDMASAVQTSLDKADTAYQMPSGGIPASDLASGVIPTVPSAYTSNPAMDGTASPGSSGAWAKGDHVHPSDTTKANQSQLAYVETSTTASRAYAVGEFFCLNGLLYRVTAAISSGGTFTPGTNCEATDIGQRLTALDRFSIAVCPTGSSANPTTYTVAFKNGHSYLVYIGRITNQFVGYFAIIQANGTVNLNTIASSGNGYFTVSTASKTLTITSMASGVTVAWIDLGKP